MNSPLLNIAVKAARQAGRIILRQMERLDRVTVERKGHNDFVSAVDRMAEEAIIDIVHHLYPSHRIIAEESGEHPGQPPAETAAPKSERKPGQKSSTKSESKSAQKPVRAADRECEWIIDPLDGTANYLHGHPQFAVSIAVRCGGRLEHGVVFDPLRDELYTASRGQGAHLNSRRIRVTGQDKLARAMLATGFPFRRSANFEPWMRAFEALLPRVSDMRRGGSSALDLAYVAAGRLDGFWESGLACWDIAAGSLLVREAGGLVADFDGAQKFLENGQIVAANPKIFNDILVAASASIGAAETPPAQTG
ncbi:MAG: inositol monophosphatase family protein [bacterium]